MTFHQKFVLGMVLLILLALVLVTIVAVVANAETLVRALKEWRKRDDG